MAFLETGRRAAHIATCGHDGRCSMLAMSFVHFRRGEEEDWSPRTRISSRRDFAGAADPAQDYRWNCGRVSCDFRERFLAAVFAFGEPSMAALIFASTANAF